MVHSYFFNAAGRWLALAGLAAALPCGSVLAQGNVRLDTSFGTTGSVTTGVEGNSKVFSITLPPMQERFIRIGQMLQANGRLWVAGPATGFRIERYLLDGTPDASFGTNGVVNTAFPTTAQLLGMALQPDGKLVAVGTMNSFIGAGPSSLALARYNQNGTLDASFGTGGLVHSVGASYPERELRRVAVLPSGKLLAYSVRPNASGTGQGTTELVSFLPNGQLDISFNVGSAYRELNDFIQDMIQLADRSLLLVGDETQPRPGAPGPYQAGAVAYRLDATGAPIASFGTNGRVVINAQRQLSAGLTDGFTEAYSAAVQPDGKILLAGAARYPGIGSFLPVLLRLNANGTPDAAFNTATSGSVSDIGGFTALGLQADGAIVVGGSVAYPQTSSSKVMLGRYTPSGAMDATFTPALPIPQFGNFYHEATSTTHAMVTALLPQPGGTFYTLGGHWGAGQRLARYTTALPSATRTGEGAELGLQAAPAPATGALQLRYALPHPAPVRVMLRDALGRTVATPLAAPTQATGSHELALDVQALPAGIYFCTLEAGARHQTIRLAVAR